MGVSLGHRQFMSVVSVAYSHAQRVVEPNLDMPLRFRSTRSYYGFANSLKLAEEYLNRPLSVLIVGCGDGYAGCSSDYAASVVRGVFSMVGSIDRTELSPTLIDDLSPPRAYDLVVSHSLAHFVLDLDLLFGYLIKRVRHGGFLVTAHEPNAGFWSDERVQELRQIDRQRRQQEQRKPGILRTVARIAGTRLSRKTRSVYDVTNNMLKTRHRFQAHLTPAEIAAIVDPHFPSGFSCRLGERGLDPQKVRANYLPECSLRWVDTSEYPGLNESKSGRLGLPGSIFTALYQKT